MAVIECVKLESEEEVLGAVKCMLRRTLSITDSSKIVPSARLCEDLEADSLDLINITTEVEASFGVKIPKEVSIFGNFTVQSLSDLISRRRGLKK